MILRVARDSFESVPRWISEARNYRGDDVIVMLVGNKIDDESGRQITTEEGLALAREQGLEDT
jgi:Ras-related protein Rab-6A